MGFLEEEMSLIDIKPRNTEPIKRALLYELYVRLSGTNECLNARLQRIGKEEIEEALDYGYCALEQAKTQGLKERYSGKQEIGLYIIMLLHEFDFCCKGTEWVYPIKSKTPKYNIGDEFVVKIAAVYERYGKPVYDIAEIPGLIFSEDHIDAMNVKTVKPGDIVYEVVVDIDDKTIYFEAWEVEDIATKEIKIMGDWFENNDKDFVYDRQEAEKLAKEYSEKYNYPVVRGGTTKRGGKQCQNSITTIHVHVHRANPCAT